ncbi:MAG: Fe-S cluster assembly protein SufD [Chloroflexi bacterium]|nr:Fe-S cluster assembly protein SufD [Chloroflexota bacterium]
MTLSTLVAEEQEVLEHYLRAFGALERNGAARDGSWVAALRRSAMARFSRLGFPTARRGNEEWKYTDIRPIARRPFQLPLPPGSPAVGAAELAAFALGPTGGSRLVFVDGRYQEQLSSRPSLPGVSVLSLAEALTSGADTVQEHLGRYADCDTHAFTALNTAFLHDGAFVHIPQGTTLDKPVHLLFLSTAHAQDTATHPRVLIVAGEGARATVVETYGGPSGADYFTNAVAEVVVGPGADLTYYKEQRQGERAFHVTTTQVVVGREATFSSFNLDLGGALARNNLNVAMDDERGACALRGLYLMGGAQHVDNQVIIEHARPYTTSRELYKGVLNGRSRAVFHGSIIVHKGARKVDAEQVDKNLLLSDEAEADTKPAFWIYCDDVKCRHGAACGQMDENALFYLRSRGLTEPAARRLLTRAFVSELVEGIASETLRDRVDGLVEARLSSWLGDDEAVG